MSIADARFQAHMQAPDWLISVLFDQLDDDTVHWYHDSDYLMNLRYDVLLHVPCGNTLIHPTSSVEDWPEDVACPACFNDRCPNCNEPYFNLGVETGEDNDFSGVCGDCFDRAMAHN